MLNVLSMPAAASVPHHRKKPSSSSSFRLDIQGLRAIAVGTVLLYHAGVTSLPGGFVGVDVFFVISGFLITGILLREITETGRVSLVTFYARRAKRILPAASVVLVSTALLTLAFLPRNRWESIGNEILASSFNVANWLFANTSTDYLRQDQAPSPVQHFWTLSVEEQFYIIWPLVLVLACLLARPKRGNRFSSRADPRRAKKNARIGVIAITLPSFLFSVYYTDANPSEAYFVTTTRLWELGIGAIVALFAGELSRISSGTAKAVGWLGIASIFTAACFISGSVPYPGTAALLPTLGAAAIIIAGMNGRDRVGVGRFLSATPFTAVGNVSYSLYLWHWPLIVIATYVFNGLTTWQGLAVVAVSFLPAIVSYRHLERPILKSEYLQNKGRAIYFGLITTCCAALAASAILLIPQPVNAVGYTPALVDLSQSGDPAERQPTGAEVLSQDPTEGAPRDEVGVFSPLAMYAAKDIPTGRSSGCHQDINQDEAKPCVFGSETADLRIALVGDSHAAQWNPAFEELADRNGWRVESYSKSSCPLVGTLVMFEAGEETYDSCLAWHDNMMASLTGPNKPDIVVTSNQNYKTADGEPMAIAMADTWRILREADIRVAALGDTPRPGINIPECILSNEGKLTECSVERATALRNGLEAQRTSADIVGDVPILDMTNQICPQEKCAVVIGGVLIYRDTNHLTATYARTLATSLEAALAEIGLSKS